MPSTATVAIVGRPNVGKSTLFNRLIGRRKAIVHDQPGVTRDRITGDMTLGDEHEVVLVDTGGLVVGADPVGLNQQVLLAVEESDALLLVVDGRDGLVAADEQVWQELRRYGIPTLLVVNKSDVRASEDNIGDFHRMGIRGQVRVSAEHGHGIGDLRDELEALLPDLESDPLEESDVPALAIVGRPNVGKSSLLNRLVGASRSLVSAKAGTTRDPVDSRVELDGTEYLLIDTAGIRRRSQIRDAPEELAVMMARRQVERADAAILVVDAAQGITSGDLSIAGSIRELGRIAVIVINKWDLLDEKSRFELEESWERLDDLLSGPLRVNISALTGRGVSRLMPAVDQAIASLRRRIETAELNRAIQSCAHRHRPPSVASGRPWKIYYVTQVSAAPPTFLVFANRSLPRRSTYRRYLERCLRESFGYQGVPIRLVIRRRDEKDS